jgi:hypothetical protein
MMEGMADVHDNAPDAFDDALAGAEVHVTPGNPHRGDRDRSRRRRDT